MKLWSGLVVTDPMAARDFYVSHFGSEVLFDSDWFVLLSLGGGELGFLKPDQAAQAPMFRQTVTSGAWVAVDVDDVDAQYQRFRDAGVDIEVPLRDEPWGDRHFVVRDPNGIPVDVVRHG
ncbi:Glyoxalase/bleomycin resistance protein/dioxygenase [Alcanivorax balearicus MACL04]|uniref:Glyoxalase/bleomycin resistance protein/dioxygenase n=1 Tax=Alloalcanivorax balearicus MACL04 TaxID=1177182 RepID=A0ABT2QU43_9GAMM|nr:VOC family protein [Alloalcanivorax balearicus]MCU5781027.1 Glyoxalase/bleomycin resistance protein/dioxygenase [Alloalcanivorax balearicus MACL04]